MRYARSFDLLWRRDARRDLPLWVTECIERAILRERDAWRETDPRSLAAVAAMRSEEGQVI